MATTWFEAASEYITTPTSCCRYRTDSINDSLSRTVLKLWTKRCPHAPHTRRFLEPETLYPYERHPRALLNLGVIPIINENDTVAVDEIKVGDNDTLSAYVTNLAQAELLVILSDQAGFHTADPRQTTNPELIHTVNAISQEIWQAAGEAGTTSGTGGMVTKLKAADIVTGSGEMMLLAHGREPLVVTRLLKGELLGTLFLPQERISRT